MIVPVSARKGRLLRKKGKTCNVRFRPEADSQTTNGGIKGTSKKPCFLENLTRNSLILGRKIFENEVFRGILKPSREVASARIVRLGTYSLRLFDRWQ